MKFHPVHRTSMWVASLDAVFHVSLHFPTVNRAEQVLRSTCHFCTRLKPALSKIRNVLTKTNVWCSNIFFFCSHRFRYCMKSAVSLFFNFQVDAIEWNQYYITLDVSVLSLNPEFPRFAVRKIFDLCKAPKVWLWKRLVYRWGYILRKNYRQLS